MPIIVIPETFSFVSFDAEVVRRIAEEMAVAIGLAGSAITVEVDETTPLTRTTLTIDGEGGISIRADSGAFEDTRYPRRQSETATATSLGRVLLRARDRLAGGFHEAPPDEDLSLAHRAAWETYSVGRLDRLGVPVNRQRWLYNFRNRHGFSDAGDAAFEVLWQSERLGWGELSAISNSAAAATVPPT